MHECEEGYNKRNGNRREEVLGGTNASDFGRPWDRDGARKERCNAYRGAMWAVLEAKHPPATVPS